jgi:hypothetical protein
MASGASLQDWQNAPEGVSTDGQSCPKRSIRPEKSATQQQNKSPIALKTLEGEPVADHRNGTPMHVHQNEDEHFIILFLAKNPGRGL